MCGGIGGWVRWGVRRGVGFGIRGRVGCGMRGNGRRSGGTCRRSGIGNCCRHGDTTIRWVSALDGDTVPRRSVAELGICQRVSRHRRVDTD